ncbi:MAG TPA: hypothetical protein VL651_09755 [Bacteroidia bacterium]|jgi:hypothetical protein|nr:hypothetical protein [Bacteroidia bacterium]
MNSSGTKRLSLFLLASSVIFLFSGMSVVRDPMTVRIEKDGAFIDNIDISKDWKVATIQRAIGKPDSVEGDAHPDAMYDNYDLGIRYWQREAKEMGPYVEEIKFFITAEDRSDPEAHAAFNGLVAFDGIAIDSTFTPERLRRELKGWRNCRTYGNTMIEFMSDTNYVYVGFDASGRELQWICVGKVTSIISSCD